VSTPNPTHIIAEGMREVATEGQKGTPGTREDGQLWGAFPNTMTIKDLAAHVVSKLTDAGYVIIDTNRFDAACNILALITDTYRGLIMDTPDDRALHTKVIANADEYIAKLREFLPAAAAGGEKP